MRVFWTTEARSRLLEIQAYIAKDSPTAARKVAHRLLLRSLELAKPLPVGRRLPEYPDDELRELLERPFRIIYRVTPEQIEIVTVKHYRQKLPGNSRNLVGPG
jgi:toxin ParE1/3/4